MKKPFYAAILLAGASLGLASCGGQQEETAPAEQSDAIEGIEVTDARLVLPPVAGNPAAIYFTLKNNGDRNIAFRNAEVEKAGKAEIHDMMEWDSEMVMGEAPPVMVETGSTVIFEPGGKHVMAFDLEEGFGEGDTTTITLIAAGSRRHSFEATAQAAGDDR